MNSLEHDPLTVETAAAAVSEPVRRSNQKKGTDAPRHLPWETTFGCPRNFLSNQFVYVVISARARGLSVGVNMNPDRECNFDCGYCEVNRASHGSHKELDVDIMAEELKSTLGWVLSGKLHESEAYSNIPPELLELRHIALSGDGEPTLSQHFAESVQALVHVRALHTAKFFKLVLITNATGLDRPQVEAGLKFFTRHDEIWAKLDAGTQQYMNLVNRPTVTLEKVLSNILQTARQRPVIIQSMFPLLDGAPPCQAEIEQYALRLKELKEAGAQIPLVQIYSATRPTPHSECRHLPLNSLSQIARSVKSIAGLEAEVF